MKNFEPKIEVISMTNRPLESLLYIWYKSKLDTSEEQDAVSMNGLVKDLVQKGDNYKDHIDVLKLILQTPSMALRRHISLTISMVDVPVAFREQLVRHKSHFWVRSSRVEDLSKSKYYIPNSMSGDKAESLRRSYSDTSVIYNGLRLQGMNEEDAKFVMPEGRLHTMMWTCTLDELIHILSTRTCWFAQEFWSDIISELKKSLGLYLSKIYNSEDLVNLVLDSIGIPPCSSKCQKDCKIALDMVHKMKGDYNQPACPLYIHKYSKGTLNKFPRMKSELDNYKLDYYVDTFTNIWPTSYRKIVDLFDKSEPLTAEQIEFVIKNTNEED